MTNALHQNRALMPSVEEDAKVMNEADGSSIENHIPCRLLHTSVGQRRRRPYKADGRLGLKVARGRSKCADVVEAGTRASVSTGHGAEDDVTDPNPVPTMTPEAAHPTSKPTADLKSSLKRSALIQEQRKRRDEVGGVAADCVKLKLCCLADWSTLRQEVVN